MGSDIAVALKNVSKFYKLYNDPKFRLKEALHPCGKTYHQQFYATKNINLEIKKGEVIGIVGKNGSGKSTLLKLITHVLTPDEGAIKVNGKISALLELGSGFNPEFTGIKNIFFYGMILGFSTKEIEGKLNEIVAFADIGEFINQPLKIYSSGMKARLAFAVAVHVDPDILILDEVLAVGDVHFKKKSYAKIKEFFESGKTIIYVSHSLGEVNRLCDRAIMLHAGEILMDGNSKTVTKFYEKYLFAKDENKQSILDEIKEHVPKLESSIESDAVSNDSLKHKAIKGSPPQEPFYIQDFESQNRVEYDDTFLKIEDLHIETIDGDKVNVLVTGERYVYCYKLSFLEAFCDVDFGMQIHNEKGVLITGSKQQGSVDFKSGRIVQIRWGFDCLMHEGIYYASTGVNHLMNGKREYINRIVDGLIFKVLPVENDCNGLVYLNQSEPKLSYLGDK